MKTLEYEGEYLSDIFRSIESYLEENSWPKVISIVITIKSKTGYLATLTTL